jgi:ATP-dependent helicase/nuclease subunit A
MHKDLGIGLTLFHPEEKWFRHTLIQHAIVAKKHKEELDEAVRVLYVAFTRAMDQLVLLGSDSDWDKHEIKYESGSKSESNYLGMVYPHTNQAGITVSIVNRDRLQQKTKQQVAQAISVEQMMLKAMNGKHIESYETSHTDAINQRLSYRYTNEKAVNMKSKYSVSEINSGKYIDATIIQPRILSEKHGYTPAEIGSIMHTVMEHIDPKRFHQPEYVDDYLQELVKLELLLQQEADTVNPLWILTLAKGDLGQRMATANILYREKAFNLLHSYNDVEVMVQGVIDCWFEEEGRIVLVDYKTGRDGWKMDTRYREQLRLYKKALETILEKPVKDTYLYLFSESKVISVDTDKD